MRRNVLKYTNVAPAFALVSVTGIRQAERKCIQDKLNPIQRRWSRLIWSWRGEGIVETVGVRERNQGSFKGISLCAAKPRGCHNVHCL